MGMEKAMFGLGVKWRANISPISGKGLFKWSLITKVLKNLSTNTKKTTKIKTRAVFFVVLICM